MSCEVDLRQGCLHPGRRRPLPVYELRGERYLGDVRASALGTGRAACLQAGGGHFLSINLEVSDILEMVRASAFSLSLVVGCRSRTGGGSACYSSLEASFDAGRRGPPPVHTF